MAVLLGRSSHRASTGLTLSIDRRAFIGSLAVAGLSLLGGCSARPPITSLQAMRAKAAAGQLTIGFIPYYEISRYVGSDKPPTGFMPDLFGLFAQAAGIDMRGVQWRAMDWDTFATVVDSGAVDLSIAGTFVTPARAAKLAFADAVFSLGNGAAVRTGDIRFASIGSVNDIDRPNVRIAVVSGEQSADYVQRSFRQATILMLDGPDLAAAPQAVLANRADVAMSDQFILGRFIRGHSSLRDILRDHPFSVLPIAWAVARQSSPVLAEINEVLRDLGRQGRIASLRRRYPMIPFAG